MSGRENLLKLSSTEARVIDEEPGDGIVVEPLNGAGPSIGSQEALNFLDNVYFSTMVFTAKTQVI